MNDTSKMKPDEQLELIMAKNKELIDALKNLRKRLWDESFERADADAIVVETEKARKKEQMR